MLPISFTIIYCFVYIEITEISEISFSGNLHTAVYYTKLYGRNTGHTK